MLELNPGSILLFLIPGLCAFCSLYGVFGHTYGSTNPFYPSRRHAHAGIETGRLQRRAFAPTPPPTNSVKAVTIILLSSVVVHGITATVSFVLNTIFQCVVVGTSLQNYQIDFYVLLATLSDRAGVGSAYLAEVSLIGIGQGLATYYLVRLWLNGRAARDRLPVWLYGWSTGLANLLDDDRKIVLASVLTTQDINEAEGAYLGTNAYSGILLDMSLSDDGGIKRVVMIKCQRNLLDMRQDVRDVAPEPLANFDRLTLEAAHIRNISFVVADWPELSGIR